MMGPSPTVHIPNTGDVFTKHVATNVALLKCPVGLIMPIVVRSTVWPWLRQ